MEWKSKRVKDLRQTRSLHMGESLWRRAVHEFDPLLDAAFQPSLASLEKLLLRIIYVREDIRGLFRSRGLKRSTLSIEGENS